MNEIEQYRVDFLEDVKATAALGGFSQEMFVDKASRKLIDAEELTDCTQCYFREKGHRRRELAIDGFLLEDVDVDASVTLVIADYRGGEKMEVLTGSQLSNLCDRALNFVEDAVNGHLQDLEPSRPYSDLAEWLFANHGRISSLRLYVVTDAALSAQVKELPEKSFAKARIDIHVWDMIRFARSEASGGREPIEIDLTKFVPGGLVALKATQLGADYEAYLCAVPGAVLADLYDAYGSRLLEGNVRSFLSVRGGVNKGIRKTIIGEPHRFFAYNNGVAATATSATVSRVHGVERIIGLKDFQIVNGGQTTASLFTARRKGESNLDNIFVQIKLSVVTPDQAAELIPEISRYANSQNKVSDADFFANHPFHRRMEEISRRVWAPPAPGASFQTRWYYERARGQYLNEQVKLSAGKKKTFQLQHPKGQVITKTDLAKFHNSWHRLPDVVSLGAQKNFVRFAEAVAPEWEASDEGFNERWFRQAVGKAILFHAVENIVSQQSWYEGGYRANIVTYTIALLSHLVASAHRKIFDFEALWKLQSFPSVLVPMVEELSKVAFDVITSPPESSANVTEWCKKPACWKALSSTSARLPKAIVPFLRDLEEEAEMRTEAKKGQNLDNKLARLTYITKRGQEYWARAIEWNGPRNILPPKEKAILQLLATRRGFVPTDLQAVVVLQAENLLIDEGFK